MSAPAIESIIEILSTGADEAKTRAQRLRPALGAAEGALRDRLPEPVFDAAWADFLTAVGAAGRAAIDGGDPQRVEDALYATAPDSPLDEETFRVAWLAVSDRLARAGGAPPFGGVGKGETWAFAARGRPWPYLPSEAARAAALARFGDGVRVVIVRGPGKSAFLADVRRHLLGAHGADAIVSPVLSAACDDLRPFLKPILERATLDGELAQALDHLQHGEDMVGAFGRAGESQPVALILDDGHLQSRSVLLGTPIFMEPSDTRNALLIVAGPEDDRFDGPLSELILDAKERELLHEIQLPSPDADWIGRLLSARRGDETPANWAARVAEFAGEAEASDRVRVARAWADDLATAPDPETRLEAGFDPEPCLPDHAQAMEILALAALEGESFHALTLGRAIARSEDDIEDLLFDDEFTLSDRPVGTCEAAVPSSGRIWADLPDGLHPVFSFADARLSQKLRSMLPEEARQKGASALRDALLDAYGPSHVWQVADRLWRLDRISGQRRLVEQFLLGPATPARVEAAFGRLLPVLQSQKPFRLALARLFGAAMEAGGIAATTGRVGLADQAFQAAAAAADRLKRPGPAGEALARLGEMRLALAAPQPAAAAFDLAEKLLTRAGHERSIGRIGLLRAEVRLLEGDLDGGRKQLERSLDTLRELGDIGHVALGLVRLGRLAFERGDADHASALLDQAIEVADGHGDPRPAAAARMARAYVAADGGQLDMAFDHIQAAAQLFQNAGMPLHVAEAAAAGLQRRSGDATEAERRLRAVADAFREAGAAAQWADAAHELGRALTDLRRFTEALEAFDGTLEFRRRARDRFALVRLHTDMAEAAVAQGDRARGWAELHRARRICERLDLPTRLGAVDADIAKIRAAIDGDAELDAAQIREEARAEIDALEAMWARPPAKPVAAASEKAPPTVH